MSEGLENVNIASVDVVGSVGVESIWVVGETVSIVQVHTAGDTSSFPRESKALTSNVNSPSV